MAVLEVRAEELLSVTVENFWLSKFTPQQVLGQGVRQYQTRPKYISYNKYQSERSLTWSSEVLLAFSDRIIKPRYTRSLGSSLRQYLLTPL